MGERKINFTSLEEMFGLPADEQTVSNDGGNPPNQEDIVIEIDKMLDWHTEINIPGVKVHPFNRLSEAKKLELRKSIEKNGLIFPIILRTDKGREGYYEVIAGHNRRDVMREIGHNSLNSKLGQIRILDDCDDIKAAYWMLDSNIQREEQLPSERADAYCTKYALIKLEAKQNPEILSHSGTERTDEAAARIMGISRTTLQRYLALKKLIPEIMEMVDHKKLSIPVAELIASLPAEQQAELYEAMKETKCPGLALIKQIKERCSDEFLSAAELCELISPTKPMNRLDLAPIFKSTAKVFADIDVPEAAQVEQEELEHVITDAIKAYLCQLSVSHSGTEMEEEENERRHVDL